MRLIATLLLTVLCFGLSAADFSAADLMAIAEKAKTMKVGESGSVKATVNGKTVYLGVVMGANGVTVAGEGIQGASFKFAFTDQGLAVQATQTGQPTKTVLVKDGKVAVANRDVSSAFGAGAVSTYNRRQKIDEVNQLARQGKKEEARQAYVDANSVSFAFAFSFNFVRSSVIPVFVDTAVTQNTSNAQAIIASNASSATNP